MRLSDTKSETKQEILLPFTQIDHVIKLTGENALRKPYLGSPWFRPSSMTHALQTGWLLIYPHLSHVPS